MKTKLYLIFIKRCCTEKIDKNKVSKIFKIISFNGGEGGIRTHERVARCWFSRPVLSTAQPPLHK